MRVVSSVVYALNAVVLSVIVICIIGVGGFIDSLVVCVTLLDVVVVIVSNFVGFVERLFIGVVKLLAGMSHFSELIRSAARNVYDLVNDFQFTFITFLAANVEYLQLRAVVVSAVVIVVGMAVVVTAILVVAVVISVFVVINFVFVVILVIVVRM